MKHMKPMKRLLGVLLAAIMVLAFGMTASAQTITIDEDLQDHTFQAYKVFSGDQAEGSSKLVNVKWADGVTDSSILEALKGNATLSSQFVDASTAQDVVDVISDWSDDDINAKAFAEVLYTNKSSLGNPISISSGTDLATGYYLLVDTTGKDAEAFNPAVLQITGKGDLEITKKTDWPSVVKKVKEDNDPNHKNKWNDAADYDIGDNVPFRLVGTVPDMSAYDSYTYTFTDTLSSGLDFNDDVNVYLVDNDNTTKADVAASTVTGAGGTKIDNTNNTVYNVESKENGFTVSFANLKTVSDIETADYIVVEYTAKLNSNAVIAGAGNPNEVTLTYSNNPNPDGEGDTDTTPKDEVVVFTFDIDVEKVDGDKEASDEGYHLSGAEFALFTNQSEANTAAQDPSEQNLTNALKFTGNNGTYTNDSSGSATLKVSENGLINIKGLDQGTYYLVETKAPKDYNRVTKATAITLTPTYTENYTDGHTPDLDNDLLTSVSINNVSEGKVTIENFSGAVLPETGGIGTTLFYVIGGILVIGAAVLLITRRRMNKQD